MEMRKLKLISIGNVSTDKNINERADRLYTASQAIIHEFGTLAPIFFFLSVIDKQTSDEIDMALEVGSLFQDDQQKDICASIVKQLTIDLNPDAVIFISETWVISSKMMDINEALKIKKKFGSFEHAPNRTECITMVVQHKDGSAHTKNDEIIRNDQNKDIKITPYEQFDTYGGRFEIPRWDGTKETIH